MTSDRVNQILLEVVNGRDPAVEDDEEAAAVRAKIVAEVAEIRAAGGEVDVPAECPEVLA